MSEKKKMDDHDFSPRVCNKPEAKVVPTPLRLVKVEMACSTLGSLRKALRLSVCTAFGVLIRTKFVN